MDNGTAIVAGSGILALVVGILGSRALQMVWPVLKELSALIKDNRLRAVILAAIKEAEKQYGPGKGAQKRAAVLTELARDGNPIDRAALENVFEEWQRAAAR